MLDSLYAAWTPAANFLNNQKAPPASTYASELSFTGCLFVLEVKH